MSSPWTSASTIQSSRPPGVLKTLSRGLQDEDYFPSNTETFAFFNALIFVLNSDVKQR